MVKVTRSLLMRIQRERKQGKTMPELAEKFSLAKATIWRLTNSIKLDPVVRRRIQSRMGGSTRRRLEREGHAGIEAQKILEQSFLPSVAPLILSSLYWAEGTKSSFVFTNTDSEMIKLFLRILRKYFKISNSRVSVMIRLGDNVNLENVVSHWSKVTGITSKKISLNVHTAYNKTTTKFGLCRITVSRGAQLLKIIMSLNKKLTEQLLKS